MLASSTFAWLMHQKAEGEWRDPINVEEELFLLLYKCKKEIYIHVWLSHGSLAMARVFVSQDYPRGKKKMDCFFFS